MIQNIYSLAREIKDTFENDKIDTVEGLSFSHYDTNREVEFMTAGHYLSGDYDEDGDLKPFRDIVTRILENQRSAEEVDTKDMEIVTDEPEYYVRASIMSKFNQDWMNEVRMDKFHNDAIEVRGKVGGLLVKVMESVDDLELEVVDWNTFSGDAADLESGLKVISHFYTPADLINTAKERGWDMEAVKKSIDLYAESDQDDEMKAQRETTGKYILVREVSGTLERQYFDEDAEDFEYSYQVHYIAGSEFHGQENGTEIEKGVTLHSVELEQDPYYYLPHKKRTTSGKTLGIGMVERSRHAQIATNKGAQNYDKAMDLASTHVLQSSSKNLKGKNVLKNMKTGTIVKTDDGKPISGVDMSPQSLAHLDAYLNGWQNQVDRATGTFAVATGEELPSGTPYRLGAILDQNAQSSFDLRREEYAIFLNRIYTERVIPWMIKKVKSKKELNLKFTPDEIKELDKDVAQYRADKEMIKKYLDGGYDNVPPVMKFAVMETEREEMMTKVDRELKRGKNRRTITDFPEGYWEQVADKLYVDITGERRDKGTMFESINNALMQYAQLRPLLEQDENARDMFNQILVTAKMKPLDFSKSAPVQQGEQPQQGGQPQSGKTPVDNPDQLTAKPQ